MQNIMLLMPTCQFDLAETRNVDMVNWIAHAATDLIMGETKKERKKKLNKQINIYLFICFFVRNNR